jgi:myosin heavy subunit
VEPRDLQDALLQADLIVRGEMVARAFDKSTASQTRDAVAKALYGRLFGWIINKINDLLSAGKEARKTHVADIGILDIFGFEHFDRNGFEQWCIK